ncbi:MAG: Smr/MutS family protein [Gallionella sp.]|nr:Smr/MutS family protein [Gallionella sp.]
MKKTPAAISPDDAALFRAAVGEVNPLPEQNRIIPHSEPRRPFLQASDTVLPDTLSDSCHSEPPDDYLSNGLSRMTLRKLRRGHWTIHDSLDLHGLNTDDARKLLQHFLHEAEQQAARCVLVIHGKGMNSPDGTAILRRLTRHWLTQHPRVLAYCDAPAKEGGSGAALILLRLLSR